MIMQAGMEALLPDFYPLRSLQIGDMQSYISKASLYFAPVSKKVFILVDNQPWMTAEHSTSARVWHFILTKYRISPFVNNSRGGEGNDKAAMTTMRTTTERWFDVMDPTLALHGFLVFEVSWRDVHGINYFNGLLSDTSLALEARYMKKWEFHSAEQAADCTPRWFPGGRASELHALRGHVGAMSTSVPGDKNSTTTMPTSPQLLREDPSSSGDDDKSSYSPTQTPTLRRRKSSRRRKRKHQHDVVDEPPMQPAMYTDTLILLGFRDAWLPFKLKQIIMSDIRLLTLLESGLPSWVIFLQSYPVVSHLYRPWMRPLARSLYALASLVTVIIGFYDLYKNVPMLKFAAARICGPLFGWIERWDMVTRIQYLGTILFLRNLRKCLQGVGVVVRAATALLRAVVAPLAELEILASVGVLFSHVWDMAMDLAGVVWTPLDVLLDCAVAVVAWLWPALQVVLLPVRGVVTVAGWAGSVLSHTYNLFKDMWETLSSIFELNHMAEAQQNAFDMTLLKSLWNDLFSQIFRAIRGILNGILVFFASFNRHKLSIHNHTQSRLRRVVAVARFARHPPSCHCKRRRHEDDVVVEECHVCK